LIHLENLAHNIREIKKLAGVKICIPVKADAYGHGAVRCSQTALMNGADCLGVATTDEGRELRDAGITAPILLFTLPDPEEIGDCVRCELQPFVYDGRIIALLDEEAGKQRRRTGVHLKIDTGMGRAGCRAEDAANLAKTICAAKNLFLAGTCTHFAASDSLCESDIEFTKKQFALFSRAVSSVRDAGLDPGVLHCAASGGVLLHPETRLDMARPGILTYGYYPGDYRDGVPVLAPRADLALKPVMELVTSVIAVKTIKAGETVSYGRTWTAAEDEPVAVLPVGYGDGLRRSLSRASGSAGRGFAVSVEGTDCEIAGRICMDQCMIRIKDAPSAKVGSRAVIFGGAAGGAGFPAEIAGTIPYEILCGISKRVPRVYVD
jgi:alanine racemase